MPFIRLLILAALILVFPPIVGQSWADPPGGGPAGKDEAGQALDRARNHLLEAMRALGDAGKMSYHQHLPELQKGAEKALRGAEKLVRDLEERLQKELKRLPNPKPGKKTPQKDPEMPLI